MFLYHSIIIISALECPKFQRFKFDQQRLKNLPRHKTIQFANDDYLKSLIL
jgi:hypothetical protein